MKVILEGHAVNQSLRTVYWQGAATAFSGTYVKSSGNLLLPATNITESNHHGVSEGLTTTSVLMTINSPNTSPYRAMVTGLQVVTRDSQVPEPTGSGT